MDPTPESFTPELSVTQITDKFNSVIKDQYNTFIDGETDLTLKEEARNTLLHSARVSSLLEGFAQKKEIPEMKVRFGDEWVKVLNVSGLSHDVGKLDPQVLTLTAQPRKLNEQEMEIVKTHAVNGADKVTEIFDEKLSTKEKMVRDAVVNAARWHHALTEKYPTVLEGFQIPEAVRFVNLADFYDALRDPNRSYRPEPMTHEKAMEIIRENGVFTADELAMIDEVGRVLQSSYERL